MEFISLWITIGQNIQSIGKKCSMENKPPSGFWYYVLALVSYIFIFPLMVLIFIILWLDEKTIKVSRRGEYEKK